MYESAGPRVFRLRASAARLLPLLRLGGERRNLAVGRIDHQPGLRAVLGNLPYATCHQLSGASVGPRNLPIVRSAASRLSARSSSALIVVQLRPSNSFGRSSGVPASVRLV